MSGHGIDIEGIEDKLRRFIASHPYYARARNDLAVILYQKGCLDEAEIESKEAIRLEPQEPEYYLNLAIILEANRKIDEALDVYKKAFKLNPSLTEVKGRYCNLLLERARWCRINNYLEKVVSLYLQVLSINPEDALIHYKLGSAYHAMGDREKALKYLK